MVAGGLVVLISWPGLTTAVVVWLFCSAYLSNITPTLTLNTKCCPPLPPLPQAVSKLDNQNLYLVDKYKYQERETNDGAITGYYYSRLNISAQLSSHVLSSVISVTATLQKIC